MDIHGKETTTKKAYTESLSKGSSGMLGSDSPKLRLNKDIEIIPHFLKLGGNVEVDVGLLNPMLNYIWRVIPSSWSSSTKNKKSSEESAPVQNNATN